MKKPNVRDSKYAGFFGFIGFLGFQYFSSGEVSQLFFFSFFSFFSFFLLGKLMNEMPDERLIENRDKARSKTIWIPLAALFLIGWSSGWPFGTKGFVVIVSALGWAATFIVYSVLFYWYEKR